MKTIFLLISLSICLTCNPLVAQNTYSGDSNFQLLHGRDLQSRDVRLSTVTAEHFGRYKAFEQFGFADLVLTHDNEDFEIYTEWYPKLDLGYILDKDLQIGPLSKVLLGGGINAFVLNPGDFFVVLAGPVWQFEVPGFTLFQLETYFYHHIDLSTSYQLTFSWDLPLPLSDQVRLRTRGFIDKIGGYDSYAGQVVAQPQLLIDLGNFWGESNSLFTGIEWRYWRNFAGQKGITESIPQFEILFQF